MKASTIIRAAMAAAFFSAAVPAAAQSASEQASIAQAQSRGALIYAYDQAAWHGTDDLLAKHKQIVDQVGGSIVDGPADAATIIFHDKNSAERRALYEAKFRGTKLVSSRLLGAAEDRTLSPERKRMIAAKSASVPALIEAKAGRCVDRPFNTVVLPPQVPGGPIPVYFLTPQTQTSSVPFGGHYMVEVGADGKAGPVRRFMNTCLSMPVPPKGSGAVAIAVNHILDPTPTELHVFTSLAARMPVLVQTDEAARA